MYPDRDKLAASTITEEIPQPLNRAAEGPISPPFNNVSEAQPVRNPSATILSLYRLATLIYLC
jgi:hypothetical protein